ncbi:pyruvate oxidase (plasmid) [Ensifer adhaerens]|uniref:thiamine pyrophosphate-binding protein n=1 Tax=Ensifer adhaerens TaxID=106592 RepID=UPI001CBD7E56|nr:thiamine pyrophosphate-binding protein [Ensifer adhaerens]MBZ7927636.1 pyruvate oxidase [Ensifer adhaerens]UAX98034.1 pyruvate oxidase [Ensifer adhaerens]UAY05415.1 pyruvate oxidase [Ensifer adhaerens]UAY12793.1 pyruvate oxidase [Ensifer adhaerens]
MANAAQVLVDCLIAWKVDRVYGLPGDGINGIIEALRQRREEVEFIQVRHEQSAAFMACAHAKLTGRLGVCLATSGPGGTNLLTGLYDAKLDQMPVLAITGMQYHDLASTFTQQDVDLTQVMEDVSTFNAQVSDAAHMENIANLACRSALSTRSVAHISIASDRQEEGEASRSRRNLKGHVSARYFKPEPVPQAGLIDDAARILNASGKTAILVGRGALEAGRKVRLLAERLAAPVVKALLGKTVLDDRDEFSMGGIGILGTAASQSALSECDTLVIIGSSFPYIEYYPRPGTARCIQIDCDAQRIGLRYPVDVGLVGDAEAVLDRLLPKLDQASDSTFLKICQERSRNWREKMEILQGEECSPLKPAPVVKAFGRRIAPNGVVIADSGQNTELAARHLDLTANNAFLVSGALASMASALPYAIAAGITFPGRPIYAVVGDGGLAMQLGEYSTAVRHRIPLKLLVICNGMLNQIAWEQMMFLGHPQFGCELAPIDFALAARAMGGEGYTIREFSEIEAVMNEVFSHDSPSIIQAYVDRYEPMMPPIMPADYSRNFQKSLEETPGKDRIRANVAREPLKSMMERKA